MRLKWVLAQLPGLTRADVQYWEARGYIRPTRIKKGRIDRRDYGTVFEKIKIMRKLYQQGLSPEEASERADLVLAGGGKKLALSAFFKLVQDSPAQANFPEASLSDLSTLEAPGYRRENQQQMFFAGTSDDLALAAKRIAPHVLGQEFIIVGDDLGALVMGACSMVLRELQPGQSPMLVQRSELNLIVQGNTIGKESQGALIFGFVENTKDIEDVLDELASKNITVHRVLSMASSLKADQVRNLEQRGVQITSLFDSNEVQKLLRGTEENK